MQLGRLGLTEDGAVIIGSVLDKEFSIIKDEEELKSKLDTYNMVVCAGMMNNMFTNQRLMDWLMDQYTEKEIEERFISSYNIKYHSELNRYTTFKHLFYTREVMQSDGKIVREIDSWNVETIREWTSGYKNMIGRLTTMCLIDFVKSTCTLDKYTELRMKNSLYKFPLTSNIQETEQKTSLSIDQERSKFWRKRSLGGQVLLIGCGQEQDFIVNRYSGGDIYTNEDGLIYKVSINGFMSKLRYELKSISIRELIETSGGKFDDSKTLEQNIDENYLKVEEYYYNYCIDRGYKNTPDCVETSKYNIIYLSRLYIMLKELRENITGIQVYEISRDRITFIIRENKDIKSVLVKLRKIVGKNCRKIFETIVVGDTNNSINYLDIEDVPNGIDFDRLDKLERVVLPNNLPKNPKSKASAIMEILKSIS